MKTMRRSWTIGCWVIAAGFVLSQAWAGGPAPTPLPGPEPGPLPAGFGWGSVISAHAVEGHHPHNDWALWEATPGKIADGSISGAACNSWELFAEDHAWMQKLGQNTALVSLEWSRLQPTAGPLDPGAVEQYRKMLTSMRRFGIEPVVILWDRTLPQWVAASGGLEAPITILSFEAYAAQAGKAFGDLVDRWVPVREPVRYALEAFKDGVCPPGKRDAAAYGKAVITLMAMHRAGWQALKNNDRSSAAGKNPCEVGLLLRFRLVMPARPNNSSDLSLVKSREAFSAKTFLDAIMRGDLISAPPPQGPGQHPGKDVSNQAPGHNQGIRQPDATGSKKGGPAPQPPAPPSYDQRRADFLIVGYDGAEIVKFNILMPLFTEKIVPPGCWQDATGQIVYPGGLPFLLKELRRYPVPQFVMLGIADAEGKQRGPFLVDHVQALRTAIADGCDVRGLFYDPLLAGFEYQHGFRLKRGLLNVNTSIQERKPAGGADVYRALALSNGADAQPRRMQRPKAGPAGFEPRVAPEKPAARPAKPVALPPSAPSIPPTHAEPPVVDSTGADPEAGPNASNPIGHEAPPEEPGDQPPMEDFGDVAPRMPPPARDSSEANDSNDRVEYP
jgi:beta-glucosidase